MRRLRKYADQAVMTKSGMPLFPWPLTLITVGHYPFSAGQVELSDATGLPRRVFVCSSISMTSAPLMSSSPLSLVHLAT
jgi:hypothetical protein